MKSAHLLRLLPVLAVPALLVPHVTQLTTRASTDSMEVEGNAASSRSAIAIGGNLVAYESVADNLVAGDTNQASDVFWHDRQTHLCLRVSVDSSGVEANDASFEPSMSDDGRFVAFASAANNLVAGDANGSRDVFVHDRQTGATTLASVPLAGGFGNSDSFSPTISADGRFVAFLSTASNLVPGDANGRIDVFVRDRQTGATARVSVSSAGAEGDADCVFAPAIRADGRFVAFTTAATNLVPGDTNGVTDVFVHDRASGQTRRVSVSSAGAQGNAASGRGPSLSDDGRVVAFTSSATNLVAGDGNGVEDAFVRDLQTGVTARVSLASGGGEGNGPSGDPSISADGRFVAFSSSASNLIPNDTNGVPDIFSHDRLSGITLRASVHSNNAEGNGASVLPSLSPDGRYVAFESLASSLVNGDGNGCQDIFVRDTGAIGPFLTVTGACPGPVTLTILGAGAHAQLAVLHGAAGSSARQNPPCAGLTLGISQPLLGTIIWADSAGRADLRFPAPPGACGQTVQVVDLGTCVASNAVTL